MMTRRFWIASFVACAVGGSLAHPYARQAATRTDAAVLRGLVLDDQRQPIDRALIAVTSADRSWQRSAISAADGSFEVTDVPLTGVTLVARRQGFVTTAYGAKRYGQPGTVVRLAPGEHRTLSIVLDRSAVITGTVRDAHGDPIANLRVSAQAESFDRVRPPVYRGASASTDERGEYRIGGLSPGTYVVSTYFDPAELHQIDSRGEDHTSSFLQTYFPGTTHRTEASHLVLMPGSTVDGTNFVVRPVPTTQVTGEIQTPSGAAAEIEVRLTAEGEEDHGGRNLSLYPRGAATFEFDGVPPGRYLVSARGSLRASPGSITQGYTPQKVWGTASINVNGLTPVSITLPLETGFTVAGRLVVEPSGAEIGELQGRPIQLYAVSGPFVGSANNLDASVGTDGRFELSSVPRGLYSLQVFGPKSQWSLRSAIVGGVDVLDSGFEVTQNVSGLVLTMTTRQTEIDGLVIGQDGKPTGDLPIVVYAAEQQYWTVRSRRVRTISPDTDGRFVVRGLPEGAYLIAAADIDLIDGVDPAALEKLRWASVAISLKLGETTPVTVKIR